MNASTTIGQLIEILANSECKGHPMNGHYSCGTTGWAFITPEGTTIYIKHDLWPDEEYLKEFEEVE